jgi:hypothetical protein
MIPTTGTIASSTSHHGSWKVIEKGMGEDRVEDLAVELVPCS